MQIVLAQVTGIPGDLSANLMLLEEILRQHQGATVAVFPELYLPGYSAGLHGDYAIPADHEMIQRIALAAETSGVDVVFGFAEQRDSGVSNSMAHIDRNGKLCGLYRKTQLFGQAENEAFVPGDSLQLTDIAGVRAGLLNCFDVEFPEHARALAVAGAELLITVAANMRPYGPDHALAVRARAVENRRFHVYVNRVLPEGGWEFVGESTVIDPAGNSIRTLGSEPEVAVVDLDLSAWHDPGVDYLRHLRALPVAQPSGELSARRNR